MNTLPQILLRQIDELNNDMREIEKEKIIIYKKLSDFKKQIELGHSHLIGRKAMCTHIDNPRPVECICTGVLALDDYATVKPLFSRNGKKYIVEYYEWLP